MHSYLILFGFTARGIENIKESPARVEAAKQTVRSMGGEVRAFYGLLGSSHDTMFIIEAPEIPGKILGVPPHRIRIAGQSCFLECGP